MMKNSKKCGIPDGASKSFATILSVIVLSVSLALSCSPFRCWLDINEYHYPTLGEMRADGSVWLWAPDWLEDSCQDVRVLTDSDAGIQFLAVQCDALDETEIAKRRVIEVASEYYERAPACNVNWWPKELGEYEKAAEKYSLTIAMQRSNSESLVSALDILAVSPESNTIYLWTWGEYTEEFYRQLFE